MLCIDMLKQIGAHYTTITACAQRHQQAQIATLSHCRYRLEFNLLFS